MAVVLVANTTTGSWRSETPRVDCSGTTKPWSPNHTAVVRAVGMVRRQAWAAGTAIAPTPRIEEAETTTPAMSRFITLLSRLLIVFALIPTASGSKPPLEPASLIVVDGITPNGFADRDWWHPRTHR
jgi:hypothetical protein